MTNMDIISQLSQEGEDSPNRLDARALLDSPHFVTVIVLKSFLKERLFDGKCDPAQETAMANSIWQLVEDEGITLQSAMDFVASQPRPKPRSQRVLENWWKAAQGEGNHAERHTPILATRKAVANSHWQGLRDDRAVQ